MNFKPILIVPGETKSVFFEIFFKSMKLKTYLSPLILICDKSTLNKEKKKYKFNKKINQIFLKDIHNKYVFKKEIYLIDVKKQKNNFYVHDCFEVAFKLIKEGFSHKLINGPINKTKTLKKKIFGYYRICCQTI